MFPFPFLVVWGTFFGVAECSRLFRDFLQGSSSPTDCSLSPTEVPVWYGTSQNYPEGSRIFRNLPECPSTIYCILLAAWYRGLQNIPDVSGTFLMDSGNFGALQWGKPVGVWGNLTKLWGSIFWGFPELVMSFD